MESENGILVFSKVENWNSVANVVNKMTLWAPYQGVVTSESGFGLSPLQLPYFISFLPQIFNKTFPSSHFPLSTSSHIRVRPLLIFTSLFIPSKLAPWRTLRDWSTEPGLRRTLRDWSTELGLNLHWQVYRALSLASPYWPLSLSPYLSLSLPGAIYIFLSLSIFHVHCLILVFCWYYTLDMKGGFFLHGLMLVVACETTFLIIFWNIMNFLSSTFLLNPEC